MTRSSGAPQPKPAVWWDGENHMYWAPGLDFQYSPKRHDVTAKAAITMRPHLETQLSGRARLQAVGALEFLRHLSRMNWPTDLKLWAPTRELLGVLSTSSGGVDVKSFSNVDGLRSGGELPREGVLVRKLGTPVVAVADCCSDVHVCIHLRASADGRVHRVLDLERAGLFVDATSYDVIYNSWEWNECLQLRLVVGVNNDLAAGPMTVVEGGFALAFRLLEEGLVPWPPALSHLLSIAVAARRGEYRDNA